MKSTSSSTSLNLLLVPRKSSMSPMSFNFFLDFFPESKASLDVVRAAFYCFNRAFRWATTAVSTALMSDDGASASASLMSPLTSERK